MSADIFQCAGRFGIGGINAPGGAHAKLGWILEQPFEQVFHMHGTHRTDLAGVDMSAGMACHGITGTGAGQGKESIHTGRNFDQPADLAAAVDGRFAANGRAVGLEKQMARLEMQVVRCCQDATIARGFADGQFGMVLMNLVGHGGEGGTSA